MPRSDDVPEPDDRRVKLMTTPSDAWKVPVQPFIGRRMQASRKTSRDTRQWVTSVFSSTQVTQDLQAQVNALTSALAVNKKLKVHFKTLEASLLLCNREEQWLRANATAGKGTHATPPHGCGCGCYAPTNRL